MEMLVPQKGLPPYPRTFFPLAILANLMITSMLFFAISAEVLIWVYQFVYFGVYKIPKIKRSKYIKFSRQKLAGLTVIQKWSCGYCEYFNSLIAYIKAVANQTEIYSCAIKYAHHYEGLEYQEKFYGSEQFEEARMSDQAEWKTFFAILVGIGIGLIGVGMIAYYWG